MPPWRSSHGVSSATGLSAACKAVKTPCFLISGRPRRRWVSRRCRVETVRSGASALWFIRSIRSLRSVYVFRSTCVLTSRSLKLWLSGLLCTCARIHRKNSHEPVTGAHRQTNRGTTPFISSGCKTLVKYKQSAQGSTNSQPSVTGQTSDATIRTITHALRSWSVRSC